MADPARRRVAETSRPIPFSVVAVPAPALIRQTPTVNSSSIRYALVGFLALVLGLAIVQRPHSWYPVMTFKAADAGGAVTLDFLFKGSQTLRACEALTGNVARLALAQCPSCQLARTECAASIDLDQRQLLGEAPLAMPSGRMRNGVLLFRADQPALALAACEAAQSLSAGTANPVLCHQPNAARPQSPVAPVAGLFPILGMLVALLAAFFSGWIILRYEHLHAHLSHDGIAGGPQKYHTRPTPRIGGIALVAGLLSAGGIILLADEADVGRQFGILLLASAPAFVGGLTEDLTKRVGVLERLLLTMLAGAAAAWLLGAVLDRLDLPGVDHALAWLPVAVIFTAFAVGGIANAVNIIDGYNGLASGFAVIVLAALAFVAHQVGDALVFQSALALAGALLGFMLWNWPGGRIFLGDGGAYLVGFMLAELAVLLVVRNPTVSPWFPLLLLAYPVFETFFSIYRKKFVRGQSPGHPDGLHFHMLVFKRLVRGRSMEKRNSRVAPYFWAISVALALPATRFWDDTPALMVLVVLFCVFYVFSYSRIVHLRVPAFIKARTS